MESVLDDINHNLVAIPLVPIDYDPLTLSKMDESVKLHLQIIHLDEILVSKLAKIYGHKDFSSLQLLYLNSFYRKSIRIHYELKGEIPKLINQENNKILVEVFNLMKRICRKLKIKSTVERATFSIELLEFDEPWEIIYSDAVDIFGERIGEYNYEDCKLLFKVLRKIFMIWSGSKMVLKDDLISLRPDSVAAKCLKL